MTPILRPSLTCGVCQQPLVGSYFTVNDGPTCAGCAAQVQQLLTGKPGSGVWLRATARGLGAALLGSAIYYGVRALTGYELGIIAIAVGYIVGNSVRKSAGGRGGWRFQALAVGLTYLSIACNYLPDLLKIASEKDTAKTPTGSTTASPVPPVTNQGSPPAAPTSGAAGTSDDGARAPAPAAKIPAHVDTEQERPSLLRALAMLVVGMVVMIGLSMVIPILVGFEHPIGLLIIGIALYEAWKVNRRPAIVITGPLRIGAAAAGDAGA